MEMDTNMLELYLMFDQKITKNSYNNSIPNHYNSNYCL